jgi:hypothetical protein
MTLSEFEMALRKAKRILARTLDGGSIQIANPQHAIDWVEISRILGVKPMMQVDPAGNLWLAAVNGEEITP